MTTFSDKAYSYPSCGEEPLGFYPLVNTVAWVANLLNWGVTSVQLRVKNSSLSERRAIYQESIELTRHTKLRLFINDDWPLAIELNAYGIHLGQQDLVTADLSAIAASNLRLGISTHNEKEVQHAVSLKPSYIACGPIFATASKQDTAPHLGIDTLHYLTKLMPNYPVVAIGGINEQRLADVLATGVEGIAVINVLKSARDPEKVAKDWYQWCRNND